MGEAWGGGWGRVEEGNCMTYPIIHGGLSISIPSLFFGSIFLWQTFLYAWFKSKTLNISQRMINIPLRLTSASTSSSPVPLNILQHGDPGEEIMYVKETYKQSA